jgi:hypothetical protein
VPYQSTFTIEKDFLRTGMLPGRFNDSSVTVYPPGAPRGAIPDPYSVATGYSAGDIDSAAD